MKRFVKGILRKLGDGLNQGTAERLAPTAQERKHLDRIGAVDKGVQILLALKYKELLREKAPLPEFADVEFRCFSQNGEDGILLYLFSLLGTTNRTVVEICAGDGIECNAANLLVNHGWTGLLFDGDEENVARGKAFYAACRDTFVWPPNLVHAWIDTENVNALIRGHGVEGPVDLLSLDLDGVDYWIWKAIDCIRPRVVIVEYQDAWGPDKAVTVPYRRDFRAEYTPRGVEYGGASLPAFVKLGREKGYRLVGCQRYGFNAFFVQRGLGEDVLPEIPAARCFGHPINRVSMEQTLPRVKDREWVEV